MFVWWLFFFQAEDGIRDLVRSRGLGDVYKRQMLDFMRDRGDSGRRQEAIDAYLDNTLTPAERARFCLLYTSDAADERSV